MKARVKATGEVVEVAYLSEDKYGNKYYNVTTDTRTYRETELKMMSDKGDYFCTYDYWTRLEHQYAGMAMQGILACEEWKIAPREGVSFAGEVALQAQEIAHALVEKLKEEK